MTRRTWVILGATSIIAERFAHLAAQAGHHLILVGRDDPQLMLIAADIQLRYQVSCTSLCINMTEPPDLLLDILKQSDGESDLFIAHSDFADNAHLDPGAINRLLTINVLSTTILIHTYLNSKQTEHHLLFLSSVAACRGRAKNSLYGGSKAAIEIYLQGLQQSASKQQHITIARLGFIDTRQTYGVPGVFYAASPEACAKACWKAVHKKKRMFYYPFFWRVLMAIISRLPFFIYKKIKA